MLENTEEPQEYQHLQYQPLEHNKNSKSEHNIYEGFFNPFFQAKKQRRIHSANQH